jgi:hypothetical protein
MVLAPGDVSRYVATSERLGVIGYPPDFGDTSSPVAELTKY